MLPGPGQLEQDRRGTNTLTETRAKGTSTLRFLHTTSCIYITFYWGAVITLDHLHQHTTRQVRDSQAL